MGYESKLFVIEKSELRGSQKREDMKCAQIVAMFDLCKVYAINFSKYPPTEHYIFAENGDEETLKDKYGDPLRELTLSEAVAEIEQAMEKEPSYRRWKPCLAMLKEFRDTNEAQWDNELAVLHYGY